MTNRRPSFQRPTASSPLRGAEDAARDWLRSAFAGGVTVDVTFSAATSATARHGLGRRYRGALLVWVSTASPAPLQCVDPAVAQAAGTDPDVLLSLTTNSAYTGSTRWVVF